VADRARIVLALIALSAAACEPLSGLVFTVIVPDSVHTDADLEVEPHGTAEGGAPIAPDRLEVSHTARGYVVEVAYYEPTMRLAPSLFVDVDGDGERGPGDLVGELAPRRVEGRGCDGVTTLDEPVRLEVIGADAR